MPAARVASVSQSVTFAGSQEIVSWWRAAVMVQAPWETIDPSGVCLVRFDRPRRTRIFPSFV